MKATRRKCVTLAVAVAAGLTTFGRVEEAEARRPRPQACRPGRYVIDGGPLTMGTGEVSVDYVKVDTHDGTVSLGPECDAAVQRYVGVRKGKRGRRSALTVLRARGEECGPAADPARVHARIDGLCDTMKGVVRIGKERVRFTAHRPAQGLDDCVEADAPEMPIHTYQRINAAWLDDAPGSAIAAAFFETARRYALGEDPQSPLERDLHKRFASMGPDAQQLLSCAVHNYTVLGTLGDSTRLLSPDVFSSESDPVTYAGLANGLSRELGRLADAGLGWAQECSVAERAGFPRPEYFVNPDGGIQDEHYTPHICEVRGVRTADFQPFLTRSDLEDGRTLEKDCSIAANFQPFCPTLEVDQPSECPGSAAAYGPAGTTKSYCYRVPWVQKGETVTLRGLNFRDTGIKVELRNKDIPIVVRTVDAYVCGDTTTPATEVVDGSTKTILDCGRVREQLSFVVPDNMTQGIYEVRVIVPKSNPLFGRESAPAYIRVILPPEATYTITAANLYCEDPTDGEWGSDEVGLKFVATRIGLDGTFEQLPSFEWRRGDIDTSDYVYVNTVIASVSGTNLGGLAVAVVGHEIDDQGPYQKGIAQFDEIYDYFLRTGWRKVAEDVGSLAKLVAQEAGAGGWSQIIGQAIEQAIHAYYVFWKPADLILADHIGLTNVQMFELTDSHYGYPPDTQKTGPEGIQIRVRALNKGGGVYRELRRYWGNDASSTYELFFLHARRDW